jgi:hypothetical protein
VPVDDAMLQTRMLKGGELDRLDRWGVAIKVHLVLHTDARCILTPHSLKLTCTCTHTNLMRMKKKMLTS